MNIETGTKFGLLTVVKFSHKDQHKRFMWECLCDCGNTFITAGIQLRKGSAKSCGCLVKINARILSTKHGLTGSPEYRSWSSMKARCLNPHVRGYKEWGGRGIKICPQWIRSFETFLLDMGKRPSSNHSLDRINVNGNYEPSNCRWATAYQQMNNRRKMGNLSRFSIEELQTEINRRLACVEAA